MKYFLIFAWMIAGFSATAIGKSLRVRLLAEVTVEAEMLRLSDLLPAEVGTRLRAAADRLSLGRAPQVGSVRVLTRTELRQAIAEIPLKATEIDIPEQVVVRRMGWPLETETVRRTLARSKLTQLDFSQTRITLPPAFTTAVPHPQFELTAFTHGEGDRGWLARMRCRERSACGSFLAEIAVSNSASGGRTHSAAVAPAFFSRPLKVVSDFGPVLVHPGRLALLVIEGDGLRIYRTGDAAQAGGARRVGAGV